MTASEQPLVSVADGVLRIAVSTAAAGTSLNFEAVSAGTDAVKNSGSEVGAVLLVGTGANFCAGGNVMAFAAAEDRTTYVRDAADTLHEFVAALESVGVPVVAGVHGWAAGAGMSLVCHADIAIGSRSTKFRPAYPALGFTPDGGMSWALPRIVGPRRARDILLSDTVLGGEEAHRLGLLTRLVGDDVVVSEAERVARSLAAGPAETIGATKRLLAQSDTNSLAEQLEAEAVSISTLAGSPTGREGVDAFVEKRRPDFPR
ncbi:putative enoyl-CoA hydratase/isomerase [Rhodococcoides trifolii]|uniref:Enoyl-CoA hydratase/isomerase n=1 Tax=Rhodococcoides trifolii TaxID=908250 RepID=A0A917D1Q7_9NOCA|nr:enoyl-CoA hydratase-related protein [Rhodococcus trifolii]GGG06476.1 putative enoyl-CoA hydratase/isomerase [Rhodococcus trifolii]